MAGTVVTVALALLYKSLKQEYSGRRPRFFLVWHPARGLVARIHDGYVPRRSRSSQDPGRPGTHDHRSIQRRRQPVVCCVILKLGGDSYSVQQLVGMLFLNSSGSRGCGVP